MRASFHPPLDALRAFGDGQAPAAEARRTAAHLEGCTDCRVRLAALRALREEIRQATTLAPPPDAWERIAARRAAGEELILPVGESVGAAPRRPRLPLRRAAVLVVGVAGIASATVPGSPVRAWLRALVGTADDAPAAPVPVRPVVVPPAKAPPPPPDAPEAGTGVAPADGEVRVVVSGAGPTLRIRVRVDDGSVAQVRGRGAAARAAFSSGRGRVTVTGAAAGELEVVLPRAVDRATLTVDGIRFVVLEDGRMTVLVPADSSGAELVFPGRP